MVVGVDRILALRDAGDVEHRVLVVQRVEAGVIAERALRVRSSPSSTIAFEHDLGVAPALRDREVSHFTISTGLAAQEAGDHHFVEIGRQRQNGRVHGGRIGADGHRDVHALACPAAACGGNARRPACASASACRWCARRRPACGTCRSCACRYRGSSRTPSAA